MKKEYIAPSVEVTKINAVQMMCTSIEGFNKNLNTEGEADGEEALSRDRNGFEATEDLQPASDTYGDLWQ